MSNNDMRDPEQSGYRPACPNPVMEKMEEQAAELRAFLRRPDRRDSALVALEEYRKASSWEETDKIVRPAKVSGVDWSLGFFILAMACIGLSIAFAVALVMS